MTCEVRKTVVGVMGIRRSREEFSSRQEAERDLAKNGFFLLGANVWVYRNCTAEIVCGKPDGDDDPEMPS